MQKAFEIIATINMANINKYELLQYIKNGATIFRINSAFLDVADIELSIDRIRKIVGDSIKILIDLPGYKLRFLYLKRKIDFKKDYPIELKKEYFNYPDFFDMVDAGAIIRINNGFNSFTVREKSEKSLICTANSDGTIIRGRGAHIHRVSYRPRANSLSDFDVKLIDSIKRTDVDYMGLSFVHNIEDVKYVEERLKPSGIKCIPKIESKESIDNVYSILKNSEMVIIDRGDLAGEIGLEMIWQAQKDIILLSNLLGCKIILATQVLPSMVKNPIPTIAEVDSLYTLLNLGIGGLQLSEETTTGNYAEEAINFIKKVVADFNQNNNSQAKKGIIFWLLGLTSSGKTSVAKRIVEKLDKSGIKLVHYDGDEVRDMFGSEFGFSADDRLRVVKNLVYLANKSASQGFNAIVSALTAYEDARKYVRENIEKLVMIFLECSKEEAARRDPKGLYRKAKNSEIKTLIGFNTTYKIPECVDLTVNTEKNSVEKSADKIIDFMIKKNLLFL